MELSGIVIVDTFPGFRSVWNSNKNFSIPTQVDAWQDFYSSRYPILFNKIVNDYREENIDWKEVAAYRVFPLLSKEFEHIELSHENIRKVIPESVAGIQKAIELDLEVVFVIYVGIGNGAGWATEYEGHPSILLGLENIVEMGWGDSSSLAGLISHETGHLYQSWVRGKRGIPQGSGPLWQLYEEGFAQHFESLALGAGMWHQAIGQEGWLDWCSRNVSLIAKLFLEDVKSGSSARRFFGSWYDVEGWKETGYYLGEYMVRLLDLSLGDAACLTPKEVRLKFMPLLEELSRKS